MAVNPFLGQTGEDLAHAAARLARVAGVRLTLPRADYAAADRRPGEITDDDLAAALIACPSALKPRDLATLKARAAQDAPTAGSPAHAGRACGAGQTGTDWPGRSSPAASVFGPPGTSTGARRSGRPRRGRAPLHAWRAWASA